MGGKDTGRTGTVADARRVDEVVVFQRLEADQLRRITDLLLADTRRRTAAQGITLDVAPEAVDRLADRGHQPDFGARPLRRVIQRELDTPLSRLLLQGGVQRGDTVVVTVRDGGLEFEVAPAREPARQG